MFKFRNVLCSLALTTLPVSRIYRKKQKMNDRKESRKRKTEIDDNGCSHIFLA